MKIFPTIKTDQNIFASVANTDLGNAVTSYYYINMAREGFKFLSLQYVITATTLTVEASNDKETVTDTNATWTDLSTLILGAANVTATGAVMPNIIVPVGRIRVKAVTTNATNALKLNVSRSN